MGGRMVVLISGTGTNMGALLDACERGEVPGEVVAVLADRDCTGLTLAENRGVTAEVVRFKDYDSRDAWSDALQARVAAHSPDLIVSAGFMRILSASFVEAFPNRIINLHPALLPAFPGAHAVRDALEHGVRVTGSTVHFVDQQVDHGPIIVQEAVRVLSNDTEESLHNKIKAVEHRLLPYACRLILDGKVRVEGSTVVVLDQEV